MNNDKSITDHLGNTFKSAAEMCRYWHIAQATFHNRYYIEKMSLEDALTTKSRTHSPVTDHLGNEFPSLGKMCDHWNIPRSTFCNRIYKFNMSLEEALTTPVKSQNTIGKECEDHLGNKYPSVEAMCCKYGIMRNTFYLRRKQGWSLEKSLTEPLSRKNGLGEPVKDHLGNEYQNVAQMCNAYGLTFCCYGNRIRSGWSLEKTLTTPAEEVTISKKKCIDHLGNEWPSQAQMCKHYGVTKDQFRSRIELGWTLEQILTNPKTIEHKHECYDHLGNKFESKLEMYTHYKQNPQIVKRRMEKLGLSYEDALTAANLHTQRCMDHKGQSFESLFDMQTYWAIGSCYHNRAKKLHWSIEKTLTTINCHKPKRFSKYISQIKKINNNYYEVTFKNEIYVWHIETLLEHYRKEKCKTSVSDEGLITCRLKKK